MLQLDSDEVSKIRINSHLGRSHDSRLPLKNKELCSTIALPVVYEYKLLLGGPNAIDA